MGIGIGRVDLRLAAGFDDATDDYCEEATG